MQVFSLVLAILVGMGMAAGFVPCFGALNWVNIPFAGVGLIISLIALGTAKKEENKAGSIAGIVICSIAILFGILRLILGGGIL